MNAVVYCDGGKNDLQGCYGSFMAVVDGEDNPRHEYSYELKTAPQAEVETALNALYYIRDLDTRYPNRVSWVLMLDAKFLVGHLTVEDRKIATKFAKKITIARTIVEEHDIEVIQISGQVMKMILGH